MARFLLIGFSTIFFTIFANLATCALEIITTPLDEEGATDQGEGAITLNRSNTDWSEFERLGVAPVFRSVFGGEYTPTTARFDKAWRLLLSSPWE